MLRFHKGILMTALATTCLLAACGEDNNKTGDVLATVNGEKIYEGEVNAQLSTLPPQLVQGREAEIRRQLVQRLVDQALVDQQAEKLDISDDEAYQKQLEQAKRQLRNNFVVQKKIESVLTEDALRQAYEATKAQRAFPAVKARHILVATEAEANNLINIATPENFARLAREKSQGPSKENGGELGWFRKEAMVPEFADVAFNTSVGTVARTPVKTQFGWHVILVEDRNANYIPPFEQVQPSLRQELAQQVAQGYMQELRNTATITYSEEISPVTVEPAAAPAEQPAQ